MKILKATAVALLLGSSFVPTMGMEKLESPRGEHQKEKDLERMNLLQLIDAFHKEEDDQKRHEITEAMMHLLRIRQDHIQAELGSLRAQELEAFSERAYHHPEHFDYTRLYLHMPTKMHPGDAKLTFDKSMFQTEIKDLEKELREIHALMSLVEKIREVRVTVVKEAKQKLKPDNKQMLMQPRAYEDTLKELQARATKFEELYGSGAGKYALGKGSEMREGFLNRLDTSVCPDDLVVGKQVLTLLPHFEKEAWGSNIDMRTGRAKMPVATIRLQDKLWDVFPGRTERKDVPYMPHMMPPHMMPHMQQQEPSFVFLPRLLKSSKVCSYKFEETVVAHMPYWKQEKVTYSAVFIPSGQEQLEPRDRSHDEVQEQLRQEIEGEGLTVPNVNKPKHSRQAVNEELEQRLGRRGHDKYMGEEKGYLDPSHIRAQTYGRVHVPDYHYGRAYERMYEIEPARRATSEEIAKAKTAMGNAEWLRQKQFEHQQMVHKYKMGVQHFDDYSRMYEPGRSYEHPRWGRGARSAVPHQMYK